MTSMYKALNLAQYIIKRQLKINKPIDNFRLNKLLYIIQYKSLFTTNQYLMMIFLLIKMVQ